MKIYGSFQSRAARCVWALEEAQVDYELIAMDLAKGEARSPSFLKLNPQGKVPVLVDGDLTLLESAAQCIYIAEKFPKANLIPTNLFEKAKCLQWIFYGMTELEFPMSNFIRLNYTLPQELRFPQMQEVILYDFKKAQKHLEEGLKNSTYIAGEELTIPDIILGQVLMWAIKADIPVPSERLKTYVSTLKSRPAFRKMVERFKQCC